MIITKTPFRLSLFGGGTDYKPWFERHGGLVIATAINRYCYITVRKLPPFFDHRTRVVYSRIELVQTPDEIIHPSIRNCIKFLGIDDGLEIHHDGDLPARSGIGSSSSFTVGLLNALHGLRHELVTKQRLAREAITVEQEWIGEHVGIQDQVMAAYGGIQAIEIAPDGRLTVSPILLPPEYLDSFEQHVLLGFTGVSRLSTEIAVHQIRNIEMGRSEEHLAQMMDLTQTALDLLRRNAPIAELGKLVDMTWKIKRRLADQISSPEIDDLYAAALNAGAYGGKLMGAGGGGFLFFIAPPEKHVLIRNALRTVPVWVPYRVDRAGSQIIFHSDQNS